MPRCACMQLTIAKQNTAFLSQIYTNYHARNPTLAHVIVSLKQLPQRQQASVNNFNRDSSHSFILNIFLTLANKKCKYSRNWHKKSFGIWHLMPSQQLGGQLPSLIRHCCLGSTNHNVRGLSLNQLLMCVKVVDWHWKLDNAIHCPPWTISIETAIFGIGYFRIFFFF